jgi:hypothetical protein
VLTTAGLNLFSQNVLGTQSTRPFAVPGAPTSSGLSIATLNNVFTPPARLTNLVNFNSAAEAAEDQLNQPGVVDTVSNGTTQVMAGTDDSGDSAITQEYLNAANNNATQQLDLPESTPTDLGDFFG